MKSLKRPRSHTARRFLCGTHLIAGAMLFLSTALNAQVSDYTFSQSNGTYTAISGTPIFSSGWDDNVATYNIPSGTFTYNGTAYNYVKVNSNGFVTFGSTTSSSSLYTPISTSTGYAGAISAFGIDLDAGSSSSVVATQSGGEVIVQWTNARRRTGDELDFQIRLNQTTGVIRIVYGSCTATSTTNYTSQVGLRGASNSDYNNRSSTSSWSSTTAGGTYTSTVTSRNTIMPASGLTFTWSPPKDIGPTALALPTALSCFTNAQPVSVTIKNQGTTTLNFVTSPVTVTANVTGATTASLSGTLSTGTLTAGSSVNVPMSTNLNMSAGGVYNFALSTSMSGDTDPSNDNATDSRTSVAPIGVTATASAANVCAGSTVNLFSTGTASSMQSVISQNFNGASIPAGWTAANNSTGGTTTNRAKAAWTLQNDGYTYSSVTFNSNDNSRFYISNSDAPGSGISTNTSLTSPAFSLVGKTAASLSFYHYYRYYDGSESANVQVSTNGSTWTTVQSYTSTTGAASAFALATIPLNAYIGQASVQVRFLYIASYDYYWALDNFDVSATPIPTFSWTSVPTGFTSSLQNPTNVNVGVNTTYKVTATVGGCSSTAQVAVNTVAPPNAGTSGVLTICAGSTVTAPQLFAKLGGTPNAGGNWSPTLAGAGTYTYTVNATSPCAVNATAQVVVSQQAQPNAGTNGALTICAGSTVTAPQLFAALGGSPNAGGSWSPTLAGAGTYTYTVNATSPCAVNATAQVVVDEQAQPDAGTNGALTICAGSTVTAPALFAELSGTPDAGGSWSPALAGVGMYTYTVTAIAPCAVNATAQVVVSEQAQPNAGTNGALTICAGSTVTAPALFAELSGTPDAGGSWSPVLAGAGTYTYTVAAISPCAVNATAQVVVSEQAAPIAGTNGALTICAGSTVTAPQLFVELGGTPDAGGSWSPALAGAGIYTYSVTAIAPCAVNATAQVVVSEQAQPNAGANASFVTCNGAAPFNLLALMGGAAQGGGSWSGPSAVVSNMYDPSTMDPGTYTYTVTATTPCIGNATASVVVNETGNQVTLRINTDGNADQISWAIRDAMNNVIASGGPYTPAQNNSQVNEVLCLSNANGDCYSLQLFDSFGDGMSGTGNWKLLTQNGSTLLGDDFTSGSVSPSAAPANPSYGTGHAFCLPGGPANIASTECGIFNNALGNKVYCNKVIGAANYQFEFSDPDAGFMRRIARPNNYVLFGDMVSNPLVPGVKYFARVRTDRDGPMAAAQFGTGCEMGLGLPQVVPCTQLISAPAYGHSCGETRAFNTNNSFIYATPVQGATEYQFRISNGGEGYDQTFIRSTYILQLKWNNTVAPALIDGNTYQVSMNVKVNGVYSGFCASTCNITIDNSANRPEASLVQANGTATMWPNPVRDGQVNLNIDGLVDAEQTITVDIQDIYGKLVFTKQFANSGERFNTILNLHSELASGVYMVNMTVNGERTVQRLSIIR